MRITLLLIIAVVGLSAFAYIQHSSVNAMLLKPHHTVDDNNHVTGEADKCSVMGADGKLMYDDLDNDNVHDHGTEQVMCVPAY